MVAASLTPPVELSPQPAVARRQLMRFLAERSWDGDVDAAVLAVHEAMVNAQRHAGGVTHVCAGMENGDLLVEVSDRGGGFGVPDAPHVPDTAAERGRGLYLIHRLASEARVVRAGRNVNLQLRFKRRIAPKGR
jgi:anti-sigma regulatory factor (Ser/Thr protein kinase)